MDRRITSWHSPNLGMEMPIVGYGHAGYPLLMFPTAAADFLEYERFYLVDAIRHFIDSGRLRVYSINSVNRYALMNDSAPPWVKGELLSRYDRYITDEVLPLIRHESGGQAPITTGASMGAYLSTFASCIPTILYATLLAGQYTTPAIHCQVTAAFTNTVPVDAYRGAGRPEATYVVERIVHQAAVEMGIAQDEIRRRNFIRSFPYQTPVALTYDTGNYDASLDKANEVADVRGFAARKAEAAKKG